MAIAELDAGSAVNLKNPFPGLRPFEVDESELFFGRDDYVYELLRLLRRNRFLAVVGSSGCGKSSVVRAGLIASLRDGFLVEDEGEWRIAIMRPGGKPIMELAKTLCHQDALGPLLEQGEETLALVHATLRRGAAGILEVTREASLPSAAKLLILVDQFEELFRFMQSATRGALDEAQAFVKLLLEAAEQHDLPVYVVLTMRSEFLGQCAPLPGLADAINQGLYLLPSMTRDQLRRAIQEPITAHEGTITNRLVNRLLNDLGSNIDQLPILQHALMRLWSIWLSDRQHGPMDLEQYQRIGLLESSLSQHAEEAFAELDERQRAIAESLFRQITDTTPDNQTIRRPSTLAAICQRAQASQAEVVAVLEKFRQEGRSFLMPPGDVPLTSDTIIDISHESLIRQWVRLRQWAEAEAQATEVYRRLQESARLWEQEGRNEDGLYRGARLAQAVEWRERNEENLNPLEQEFLTAGVVLQKQEQEEEEQRRQSELEQAQALAAAQEQRAREQTRAAKRLRWLAVALFLIVLIAGWVAWQAREGARRNQTLLAQNYWSSAVSAAKQSEWLGTIHFSARAATEERDPLRLKAAVLHTQAFTRSVFLGTAVTPAHGAVFSQDESLVLTWSGDGTARLWRAGDGSPVGQPMKH
ncbi:MAG TPA: hypothetical protein VKK81_20275, partial [Candidatus Binatia bacterium]|nr:hypothetical protein [Candidatus Binatia bacterium]